jgi:hypothetical protein
MAAENPAPDNDTMLTLIETNEQLSLATTKHQRTVLQTRKALGVATPDPLPIPAASPSATPGVATPPGPVSSIFKLSAPPSRKSFPKPAAPIASEHSASPVSEVTENPFKDPVEPSHVAVDTVIDHNEPYHPGFSSSTSYRVHQEPANMHAGSTSGARDERDQQRDSNDDDDDAYAAPAQPVYRY